MTEINPKDLQNLQKLFEAAEAGQLSLGELRALRQHLLERFGAYLTEAKNDPLRDPRRPVGSPLDSVVQRLAAFALRFLKRGGIMWIKPGPTGRPELHVNLDDDSGLSYQEIGERFGASRQRIQQLFEQLCPLDHQAMKRRSPSAAR